MIFNIQSALLQWVNVIFLAVAVAIGGCSIRSVSQLEKNYEANAPSDQTELTKEIQKKLKEKGFDPGPIDGIAGSKTLSALTEYQKKYGLASTNGINAKAYGQLSIWESTRSAEQWKREQKEEQTRRATTNISEKGKYNSSNERTRKNSSSGSIAKREAAKRKELSRNYGSVNFQVSCPGLYIPKIYEKKYQNMIPVYAMVVLNNSTKRYSVNYDLVYKKGTKAVATKNVFGTTLPGRQGFANTLTETKDFSVRPGALTEFLLIKKYQGAGSQITEIKAVDVFKCTSP